MSVVETCAVCGLELDFFPQYKGGKGEYFHRFSSKNPGKYKFIHLAVPQLEDPSITEDVGLYRNTFAPDETFNTGGKVEPRASVAPEAACGDPLAREKRDVRIFSQVLKSIFEAR
jgi:hypothetical protein